MTSGSSGRRNRLLHGAIATALDHAKDDQRACERIPSGAVPDARDGGQCRRDATNATAHYCVDGFVQRRSGVARRSATQMRGANVVGAIEMTAMQEAVLDLGVEQVLSPALTAVNNAFVQTMMEHGIPIEAAKGGPQTLMPEYQDFIKTLPPNPTATQVLEDGGKPRAQQDAIREESQ